MKIIGVIGSANLNGNGATLAREALEAAAAEGAETREIFLAAYRIEFCRGCLRCMSEGGCPQEDDFAELGRVLREADGIIFSFPTFGYAPNARMKCFIERFGLFEYFTSSLGGKYLAAISTASRPGAAGKAAKGFPGLLAGGIFQRGYISGTMGAKAQGRGVPVREADRARAAKLGRKLAVDIKSGRRYLWQNLLGRLVNRLVVRPGFREAVLKHRGGMMQGVYCNLKERGLI